MNMRLDGRAKRQLRAVFNKHDLRVGVLEDGPHYKAISGTLTTFAGGPARKRTRTNAGTTLSEVSEQIRKVHLSMDYLRAPFKRRSSDIMKFTNEYLRFALGRSTGKRRCENLLQAVVRNPILRQDYGPNSKPTATKKGFNRFLIDTGQFFKSVKARITVKGSRV